MKNNLPNRVVMVERRLGRLGIESEESSGRGLECPIVNTEPFNFNA